MSNKVMTWAIDQEMPTPTHKLVLLLLADRANGDDYSCFPSMKLLAEETGVSVRRTRQIVADIDAAGMLRRGERWRDNGGQSSNMFYLGPPGPEHPPPLDPGSPPSRLPVSDPPGYAYPPQEEPSLEPPVEPSLEPTISRDDAVFAEFYSVYPLKVEPKKARKAWDKIDPVEFPAVLAGAARYRDDPNRIPEFTKYPATWLNAGCWEDEPLPSRTNSNDKRTHQPIEEWWDRSEPSGELEL